MLFGVLAVLVFSRYFAMGKNVPSLLTANASLAIVLDRGYLQDEYEAVKAEIEKYLAYARLELLKHGGVDLHFYSWAAINIRKDLTGILSITTCSDTWRLFRSSEGDGILHLAITEPDCPRLPQENALTIPVIRKGQELPQLLLDLRTSRAYKWKSVAVIYDETLGRDTGIRVIKAITQRTSYPDVQSSGISLLRLKPNVSRTDLENLFCAIHTKATGNNFLVIADRRLLEGVMKGAKFCGLVGTGNQWLYVISNAKNGIHDVEIPQRLLEEGDNVAFIYNTSRKSNDCVGGRMCQIKEVLTAFSLALDQAVQEEYDTASQIAEEEWEAIRPNKLERRDFLLKKIKNYISEKGVCDNCTFWEMKAGDTWGTEYQRSDRNPARVVPVGTWRPSDGATMTDELFLHVAHGFRGKMLPMVTFHNPPWQILRFNSSGAIIGYSGMVFEIMRELAKNLNFTFSLETIDPPSVTDNASVYDVIDKLTNQIPSSLVHMVKNKTVALGACAVTVTDQMKNSINFTSSISAQAYSFLVARPRELSRALLFISPFTGDTWLCLAGSILGMGPILYYVHKLSPFYEYKGIPMRGGLSSVQNCIWYMYGALLQQGGMHLPLADSARIIVGSWWLVVLVIATTYCGNLVAFLTFPKIDIAITTVEELVAHRDTVSWSLREGSFLENELENSSAPRYQLLYKQRSRKRNTNIDSLIESIEQGKHVYVDWKMRLQFIMKKRFLETGRCEFTLSTEDFFEEELSLILPQGSPYLPRINEEIKKLHQVGLIHKWLQDYLPKKDKCWKNQHLVEVSNHTVNMDDMQGIFFVLFLGFSLSLVLLLFETIWNKQFRKKQLIIIKPFTT